MEYFPALTGLRFLLGLWVILHHLTGNRMLLDQWNRSLPVPAQSLIRGGYLAVQTFFLLSGFVLAQSYAKTRWNRQTLTRFAIARLARIYPAYLLSLGIISWFAVEFAVRPGHTLGQKFQVICDYIFLLQGWRESLTIGWNTPAWSLSCEFFFYLCFPLLLVWLCRGGLAKVFAALAACFVIPILLAHAEVPPYWKPIHHLSDFAAGIAAARIYGALARPIRAIRLFGFWLSATAIAAGAAIVIFPHVLDGTLMNLNTVLRPLNVALLIGFAMGGGFLARLLSSPVAGYLGKVSYSMYILHVPLLWWFSQYTTYRYGSAAPAWIGFLFIGLVIGFSIAAYEFVEVPANRRIRGWSAARGAPQNARAAAAA